MALGRNWREQMTEKITHPIATSSIKDYAEALVMASRPGAASLLWAVAGLIVLNAQPDHEFNALAKSLRDGGFRKIRELRGDTP